MVFPPLPGQALKVIGDHQIDAFLLDTTFEALTAKSAFLNVLLLEFRLLSPSVLCPALGLISGHRERCIRGGDDNLQIVKARTPTPLP